MMSRTTYTQLESNRLPLAPIGERTTIANYLAKARSVRIAPVSKIGKLLESKVHSGRF